MSQTKKTQKTRNRLGIRATKIFTLAILLLLLPFTFLAWVPIKISAETSIKLGINTDYWSLSPQQTKDRMQNLGITFFSKELDCRFAVIGGEVSKIKQLAQLFDGTDMVIHVLFNPLYGFQEETRSEQWWTDVVTYGMDQLKVHSSVKYVGLYTLEHYAGQLLNPPQYVNEPARNALTQQQIANAYSRFNALATARGFTVLHWGLNIYGKNDAWNTESWFASICGGQDKRFWAGGYPDPYAGWIWTENPPSAWQYEWVRDYEVIEGYKNKNSKTAMFTGMWSSETSRGTTAGAGWTYRNTNWWLTAIKENAPDLQYAVFEGWVDVLLSENTEWQRAVLEFTGGVIPPPTQYTLTIVTTTGGTTSPSPGSYDYDENTIVSVLAIPDSGYVFNKWVYDSTESTENPITMEMTRDYTLTAYFVEQPPPPPPTQYTLTIVSTSGGTTSPTPGSYDYDEGTKVQVLALPNSGYLFDKWIYDSTESIDNPIELTIDQDYTLTAYFKEQPPPPPINGNLSIDVYGVRNDVTVTVTVNGHVDSRTGPGIVSFEEMAVGEYNCSVSASGYITETLSVEVIENTTQTYTVTLTPALIVSKLTLTNPSVGTQGCLAEKQAYTFQANISNPNQELNYVNLILDPTGENLTVKWTRSDNTFNEESDPNNYITLSGNSLSNGNQWTLNFQITFSWNYPDEGLHSVRLICMNASNIIKSENFANVYRVENDLIIYSANVDDDRVNPSQNITFDGYVYYQGTITPPPSGTKVHIKLGGTVKGTATTSLSGYYTKEISAESAVGSYTYNVTCEHSNEDKTVDVDVDKLEGLITADSYEVSEGTQVNLTLTVKRQLDDSDVVSFTATIGRNGTSWLTISNKSFNDTGITTGHWTYSILSLIDNTYGLNDFDSNSPTISWGQKTVEIWDGGTTNDRIDVGTQVTLWFKANYSATGKPFGGDNGTLYINGTEATWNGINNRWEYSTSKSAVAKGTFRVTIVYDSESGSNCIVSTLIVDPSVVWDRVQITLTVTDNRIDVGSTASYTSTAFYEYDSAPFIGTVTLNDTLEKNIVGKYVYGVTSISDSKYGLTLFTTNSFYVIFDRIRVVNYAVSDANPEPYDFVWVNSTIKYEYDDANLSNGAVYINGSIATFYTDHWALGVTFNELGSTVYHVTEIRDNEHGLTAIKYEASDPEVDYVLKYLGDVKIVMPSEWEAGKSGDITIWIKNTDNYDYKNIYVNVTFESQNSSVNSVLNHRLPNVPSNNELTYQINILPPQNEGNYIIKIFIFYSGSRFELYDLEKQVNVKNPNQTSQLNGSTIAARIPEFTSIIIATSLGVCVYLLMRRRKKKRND